MAASCCCLVPCTGKRVAVGAGGSLLVSILSVAGTFCWAVVAGAWDVIGRHEFPLGKTDSGGLDVVGRPEFPLGKTDSLPQDGLSILSLLVDEPSTKGGRGTSEAGGVAESAEEAVSSVG